MNQHRHGVRPRYGRVAALVASSGVTLVAVLGGMGVLPSSATRGLDAPAAASVAEDTPARSGSTATNDDSDSGTVTRHSPASAVGADSSADNALPAGSGTGKRVVFSQSRQRVWLVSGGHHVERTYLVSGSVYDNLDPGTYSVYSRSEQAWGIEDSGTMKYFVRFAHGDNAAIGFHDIPVDDGEPLQTVAQLGTPQSHGCIRQRRSDAIALWKFAPIGTKVVVTA